ncbi:hypothetical protein QFC19_002897 [Naganishia cerealis]|uniref:Uncharacterized protein n=1 Tax=Naganishia cerealis TaxID=610337 RepID=A0ACC2W6I6_9TREE|nr:hypothetical protein QFC19_002897 [Naganishia cerealis]
MSALPSLLFRNLETLKLGWRPHGLRHIFERGVATLPSTPKQLQDEKDHTQASEWVRAFKDAGVDAIPEDSYTITMSRSSGPGGQNVNKLSTKASLRLLLDKAKSSGWLPGFVLVGLVKTVRRHFLKGWLALAATNRKDSVTKLHELICSTAQSMIVTPTSDEQKSKVKGLIHKEAARRKSEKVKKSMKKENRKKGGWE